MRTFYGCVLGKVEVVAGRGSSEDGCLAPGDGVVGFDGVLGDGGDVEFQGAVGSAFISGGLVLFDAFENGAVGLADVAGRAVLAGDGVDRVRSEVGRSRRFDVGEGVSQGGGGGKGNIDVVGGEDLLEGFGQGVVVG